MLNHGNIEHLLKDIIAWAQMELDIIAVYLYGSHAQGRANALSDVDVALLAKLDLDRAQLWRMEDRWAVQWSEQVDLRLLNLAPLTFRYEVTTQGRRVWACESADVAAWESLTWRRYWDLRPLLDDNWQRYIEHVQEQRNEVERQQYQTALAKVRAVHQRVREAASGYLDGLQK